MIMNIFRLHNDPIQAAQMLIDKHVVKMACESCQILHTSLRSCGCNAHWLYKSFNPKHPSCIWATENKSNFMWLIEHGIAICEEYTKRYHKTHKCLEKILLAKDSVSFLKDGLETKQLLAMPTQFFTDDPVHSYRLYYAASKFKFATWKTPASEPYWWNEYRNYVKINNLEVVNDKNDGIQI